MKPLTVFKSDVYMGEVPEKLRDPNLINEVYKLQYPEGYNWSSTTRASIYEDNIRFDSQDSPFFPITAYVAGQIKKVIKDFYSEDSLIYMTDGWANIAGHMGFQEHHVHTNTHFSAVIYLKASSGDFGFKNPYAEANMFRLPFDDRKLEADEFSITPKEWGLLIFRSYMPHIVRANLSNEDRISLAFNFVVKE